MRSRIEGCTSHIVNATGDQWPQAGQVMYVVVILLILFIVNVDIFTIILHI